MAEGDTTGIGEELKGSAKKAAGQVLGDSDMEREGEAQRTKADKEREAQQAEAAAQAKRDEALRKEGEQRSAQ